ncbi:Rossmann-like and DUF2520 domain-containing protein [Arthrobacter sp. OAP107]|uniref:Rossmann-like and DUF2520 domain-containing protein n=1 Tax=Arthrobacter sp. OAP107 TaxID=3156445 RepID=UPI00339336C0
MHISQQHSIGLVGAGKVGIVLATALVRAGHTVVSVWDPSPAAIEGARETLGDFQAASTVAEATAGADLVLLAVPDDVLQGLVQALAAERKDWLGVNVVHVSGRYGAAVLSPLGDQGAAVIALHPAMAFSGDRDTELSRITGARFAVTANDSARKTAESLVHDMGGIPFKVAESDRVLYHAAMAHATNHLVTLIVQSSAMLASISVNDTSEVLRPALAAALDNALLKGAAGATGPVVRGDIGTVTEHIRALAERTPESLPVYRVMSEAAADIALTAGRISEEVKQRIEQIVGVPSSGPEPLHASHRS